MENINKTLLSLLFAFSFMLTIVVAQEDTINLGIIHQDSISSKVSIIDTAKSNLVQTADSAAQSTILSDIGKNVSDQPIEVLEVISISKIFWTIVILILAYYFIQFVIRILVLVSERSAKLRIAIKGFIPIFRIVMWTIVIFAVVKGIFNPPFETVLAFTASIGIAVGFAAQDILKNVFGGVALIIDRPFKVGDKIDSGKHYGEVLEIGLRVTKIVTPDDSVVSVPNSDLVNSSVSNSNSGELNCQVVAEIFLPIDIDTQKVRKIAIESAQVSRYVYLNKPITVLFFNEVKEHRSYLKMRLKAYVMDIRYEFQFKSDMTEIVLRELFDEGLITKEELT